MTLEHIAQATGKDVSTISRAIHQKYLQTPWRMVALRELFHGGIEQSANDVISSEEIKSRIKEFIANEDGATPLSDQAIGRLLHENGVSVSRRTVTKYREELGILSSLSRRK